MTTSEGSTIILRDIGIEPQDGSFMFILRYLIYLLATFDEINRDIDAERLATRNFAHYARKVERHGNQSVSKFLEPAISPPAKVQRLILEDMVDQMDIFLSPDVLNSMRDRPKAQLLVIYTGSCPHKSFAESPRIHNGDITQGDRLHLLNSTIGMLQSDYITTESGSTDRISKASILDDLLQADLGSYVFRSSFELFDEAIQKLIPKCHIEPLARRERVPRLWTQIRGTDRTKVEING